MATEFFSSLLARSRRSYSRSASLRRLRFDTRTLDSAELAELFSLARSTLYRALQRAGEPTPSRPHR